MTTSTADRSKWTMGETTGDMGGKTGRGPRTRQKVAGWVGILCPPIRFARLALSLPKKGAGWRYQVLKILIFFGLKLILELQFWNTC